MHHSCALNQGIGVTEPVSLAARRVDRSNDCRDWTPLEALRELVKDIESGARNPRAIYVAMESETDEASYTKLGFVCAGADRTELVGLLMRHVHLTCKNDS